MAIEPLLRSQILNYHRAVRGEGVVSLGSEVRPDRRVSDETFLPTDPRPQQHLVSVGEHLKEHAILYLQGLSDEDDGFFDNSLEVLLLKRPLTEPGH